MNACTCGEPSPHIVARRRTADGYDVCLWDDGAITGALGSRLRGVPMRRPRSKAARALALKAGRLLLGEVCIHDLADLGPVYAAAELAAREDGMPGTVRRILAKPATPTLAWTVLHADRDGRPTERVARLSRLRWPGLAVWDYCGGPGSRDGRYVVVHRLPQGRHADESYVTTGMAFHRLDDLWAYLRGIPAPEAA